MSVAVKVCGITRLEDARAALACGAQALGFVFYPPSGRYVTVEQAAAIVRELPPYVVTVGVFVNESAAHMNAVCAEARLDRVQLHGEEPHETLAALDRPGYRAFRVRGAADREAVEAAPDATLLLDTFRAGEYGGTGRTFDWEWARGLGRRRRIVLAGGLTPDNVREAVRTVQPAAVDVSSAVEAAPGRKDPEKLAAFFAALAGASGDDASDDPADDPERSSGHARAV